MTLGGHKGRNVVDFATLAVTDTAKTLADASPALTAGATVRGALFTFEDIVRVRTDGTAAVAGTGHEFKDGGSWELFDANYENLLGNLSFIVGTGGSNSTVHITYLD